MINNETINNANSILNIPVISNIPWHIARQLFYSNNVANINYNLSTMQYYNDPISLYNYTPTMTPILTITMLIILTMEVRIWK